MRRTALLMLLMMTLFIPSVFADTPVIPTAPQLKPVAQLPVLKTQTPLVTTDTPALGQITNIRWSSQTDAKAGTSTVRLVLDVSGPVTVDSTVSGDPTPQLIVNINGAVPAKTNDVSFDGKVIDRVRLVRQGTGSKFVIDLPLMLEEGEYKVFTLPSDPVSNRPYRVVVDINKAAPAVKFKYTPGLKGKVIVLDPGHGGSDSGAIGPGKSQEKTITLAVAQKLKALLEAAGAKVVMTRQTDKDVFGPDASAVDELKARATVANNIKADVFVSIHINAFTDPSANGTATYYYQKTPFDALLAQSLQDGLIQYGGRLDRGIYPARFYVIRHTVAPAALAELAFISNPTEEKLLNTPEFQQKMAQGLAQGLDKFFAQAARLGGDR